MIQIKHKLTGEVIYTSERESVREAIVDAVGGGAYLGGADLRGAYLRGAYLGGANLEGANLESLEIPIITNIHQTVYAAATATPDALDMTYWHHNCGTTHCRAGWVTTLAGEAGRALEEKVGPATAGYLIYRKSDPSDYAIDFFGTNEKALADMKEMAEKEARGETESVTD